MPTLKTVRNPNYKQIETLIQNKVPFVHAHSMSAEWFDSVYCVFSYRTIIAEWGEEQQAWYLNPSKYSVTTSKQQNLVKRAIAGQTIIHSEF